MSKISNTLKYNIGDVCILKINKMDNNIEDFNTKAILIFDEKGNYFCETIGTSNAAKITNGNPANIHRAANNGDLISTNGYYFITKMQMRNRTIESIEKVLKIIIACNGTKGLGNRINEISKIISK